jgi:hypothetical protein
VTGSVVVITSCTGVKVPTDPGQTRPAEALYAGQQHVRLMRGVRTYREAFEPAGRLRLRILSAEHGVLRPQQLIETYDHTFSGLGVAAIRREGRQKRVPDDMRRVLAEPFTAGVMLLGETYLRACEFDQHVKLGGPLVCFCSPASKVRMPALPGLRLIALTNDDARRFSVSLVGLKGELGGRLLSALAEDPSYLEIMGHPDADLLSSLEAITGSSRVTLKATA